MNSLRLVHIVKQNKKDQGLDRFDYDLFITSQKMIFLALNRMFIAPKLTRNITRENVKMHTIHSMIMKNGCGEICKKCENTR